MSRVVLLIRNAAKSDFGGAETYQISLAKILQENAYEPVVISRSRKLLQHALQNNIPTKKGWWWSRQDWSGRKILLTPLYILWQLLLTFWYIQLIIRTKASVLHIQSKDDFIAGTIAGRLLGKKVVWTDHMDLRYIFRNLTKRLRNPVGKLVFWAGHLADHIILISDNEYKLVISNFKKSNVLESKIIIIKNGVIDKRYQYKPSKSKEFIFCTASRLVDNKGIVEAINAFKIIEAKLETRKDLRLHIYGGGLDSDVRRFKAISKDNQHIIFFGHQEDALEKISDSNVFMLPSYQEGFSIALLEATMLGKAIIASDVDSNPELVKDGVSGLLVRPKDSGSLAEAMLRLAQDSVLLHKVENGARKNFESHYDLKDIVASKIIPLYS